MSKVVNPDDFTLKIGDLVPKEQELASVNPTDDLSQAVGVMKDENYSQLPVIDESGRLKGVVSWRTIGESAAGSKSPMPKLVRCCMDTTVTAIDVGESLFDVIQEIAKRDYIVVKDSSEITGIVTATDLAKRFGEFSRAFAYIGEIDLLLRNFTGKQGKPDGTKRVPGFYEHIKALERNPNISEHFIRAIREVKSIRNRVMHFKYEILDGATDKDLKTLETALKKTRTLAEA